MLTWTDLTNKAVRLSRDTTPGTKIQLQQDMNTGYHLFNAKLSRYFSRKQQFADTVVDQHIYQTPLDCIRIIGMTMTVGNGVNQYKVPVKEIRSEYEWRQITSYNYSSNWQAFYIMLGNDSFDVWPTPSESVSQGIRFYYQQADHDLSVNDITNTSTGATLTVTNGSTLVTASNAIFTPNTKGLSLQLTSVNDLSWYEIIDVPTTSTIVLKSAFVGLSGGAQSFRIGQIPIIPQEYHDSLVNYALYLFFSSKGNTVRANQCLGLFKQAVDDAIEEYSSSSQSSIITDDSDYVNSWTITPLPGV